MPSPITLTPQLDLSRCLTHSPIPSSLCFSSPTRSLCLILLYQVAETYFCIFHIAHEERTLVFRPLVTFFMLLSIFIDIVQFILYKFRVIFDGRSSEWRVHEDDFAKLVGCEGFYDEEALKDLRCFIIEYEESLIKI